MTALNAAKAAREVVDAHAERGRAVWAGTQSETGIAARPSSCWPIRRSAGRRFAAIWPELSAIDPSIAMHLEIDAKYDVYLKRQIADVDAFRRDEGLILGDIDYRVVPGLSNEARSKLEAARPRTVGQAGRLDGLTPAALGILAAYLRREARRKTLSRRRRRAVSRETTALATVIASAAKQSTDRNSGSGLLRRFAPRNDGNHEHHGQGS